MHVMYITSTCFALDRWHSIWLNFNAADKHTSRILAYEKEALKGCQVTQTGKFSCRCSLIKASPTMGIDISPDES